MTMNSDLPDIAGQMPDIMSGRKTPVFTRDFGLPDMPDTTRSSKAHSAKRTALLSGCPANTENWIKPQCLSSHFVPDNLSGKCPAASGKETIYAAAMSIVHSLARAGSR